MSSSKRSAKLKKEREKSVSLALKSPEGPQHLAEEVIHNLSSVVFHGNVANLSFATIFSYFTGRLQRESFRGKQKFPDYTFLCHTLSTLMDTFHHKVTLPCNLLIGSPIQCWVYANRSADLYLALETGNMLLLLLSFD